MVHFFSTQLYSLSLIFFFSGHLFNFTTIPNLTYFLISVDFVLTVLAVTVRRYVTLSLRFGGIIRHDEVRFGFKPPLVHNTHDTIQPVSTVRLVLHRAGYVLNGVSFFFFFHQNKSLGWQLPASLFCYTFYSLPLFFSERIISVKIQWKHCQ